MKLVSIAAVLVCASFARAATHVWVSFDGNFAAPTSWSTGKGPNQWASTDSVVFSGTVQTSATAGLDHASVRVASFLVDEDYSGSLGNIGAPLVIAAETFTYRGLNTLSYRAVQTTGKMDVAIIDAEFGPVYLWGDHDYLIIKGGVVDVQQSAEIRHTLFVDPNQNNPFFSPGVTIFEGSSIPRLIAGGGYVENRRDVDGGHELQVESGQIVQTGVIQNNARLRVEGGHFIYDPVNEPSQPGPVAEFQAGYSDFRDTFYEVHFKFGIKSYRSEIDSNDSLQAMGIFAVDVDFPSLSVIDRGDADGDGIFNPFDACAGDQSGDTDGDCRITLKDFATMQNGMTGP